MMKRLLCVMLAMCLFLPMVACEDPGANPDPVDPPPQQEEQPPQPDYTFAVETVANKYSDDEGSLIASYSYRILRMNAADTAPEEIRTMAEVFNAEMDTLLESCLETGGELREWAVYDERIKEDGNYYTDELTVRWDQVGRLVSVGYDSYLFAGGPHPTTSYFSYLFDLDRGAFIDPTEMADDPELLRATVTDLIADEIDGMDPELRGGLFEDYISTVSQWNSYSVRLTEEAMTVTFSAYALGPYALGALSFTIPYEEIRTALGSGGLAKLGLAGAEG